MADLRYYAACCQTDLPNPRSREQIRGQVDHMIAMIDRAVDRSDYDRFVSVATSDDEPKGAARRQFDRTIEELAQSCS